MLTRLSIRDYALIERLDLEPRRGFTSLTGRTGAGKSIILGALGLCLGAPADKAAVRAGCDAAIVAAEFELDPGHPAWALLEARGVAADPAEPLVCRRAVRRKGPARAFVNDQAVSAAFLRELADDLVEIHGQGAASALLRPSRHRGLLDQFAGAEPLSSACAKAWSRLVKTRAARAELESKSAEDDAARDWLANAVSALDALAPRPGEVTHLAERRALLMQADRLASAVWQAQAALEGQVEADLVTAAKAIERVRRVEGLDVADPALSGAAADVAAGLERALIEVQEAVTGLAGLSQRLDRDEAALVETDERLHALRGEARKHGVDPDGLADLHADLTSRLDAAGSGQAGLLAARAAETDAAARWRAAADALGAARRAAAARLEDSVEVELAALKLERARVRVAFHALAEDEAGAGGAECVAFEVETSPGAGFGPLERIASGGELARFSLALACVLGQAGGAAMVFDEVDQGVGGAVAAAVGARLKRLAASRQVFAITHSPQVAACGDAQWRVSKHEIGGADATRVDGLDEGERTEEIARMLSGAVVTPEARAAASRLLSDP